MSEVMGLSGPQFGALIRGHARAEAAATARAMAAVRAAVWADRDAFAAAIEALGEPGGDVDRGGWIEGWDGPECGEAGP